jgi:hypothetical protein
MFKLNRVYNFNTIAPVTLSQTYRNMKVIASDVNFKIAVKFMDVMTIREQIIRETGKQLLDPRIVSYTMFENEEGDTIVLANDWIDPKSINLVENIDLIMTIKNITTEDMINIKNVLNALGYNDIEIQTVGRQEA